MGGFSSKCGCACSGTCGKAAARLGGRILTFTTPSTPYHGQMASNVRRKLLVCFYCNRKSGTKYDGLITSWECARCTSTNFLDENGEIIDPPVSTNEISSNDLKYSFSRADAPTFETSSQGSSPSPFCATCLKNQHLFISSLQQFHVELDPFHPEYRRSERNYYKFKKHLEELYPQVCEDCFPNVQRGLEDAHRTSKSDIIRRTLSKSRLRARQTGRGITVAGTRDLVGRSLWFIGLLAEVLWHIITLSAIADRHTKTGVDPSLPIFISDLVSTLSKDSRFLPEGRSLGSWGLFCSSASFWWNPKFDNLSVGFTTHIRGYKNWYKHQLILLVVRGLFYFVMAHDDLTNSSGLAVGAAHLFILVFVTFLTMRAHSSIRVEYARLWSHIPTKMPCIGPGSSPKHSDDSDDSMINALNNLRSKSSHGDQSAAALSTSSNQRFKPDPYVPGSIRLNEFETAPLQPMKELNIPTKRGLNGSPMFISPLTHSQKSPPFPPSLDQQAASMNYGSMDWSPEPSPPKSKYRAFTENLPVDRDAVFFGRVTPQENTKLFGHSPVVPEPTAFWFKVPPAPVTPAHRLRNPPNQPRIRSISQERKQNFFGGGRSKPHTQEPPETTLFRSNGPHRSGMELAEQKFFAPDIPSTGHDDLVSAFNGWSLGDSDDPKEVVEKSKTRARHVGQGVALSVALVLWNQALNNSSQYTKHIVLAVLIGCLCIGTRTILDNTLYTGSDKQRVDHALAYAFGSCIGGLECAGALYGLIRISGGPECDSCGPLGTILTGAMLVHELWQLLFA